MPIDDTEEMPLYIPVMARLQLLQALADRGQLSNVGQIEHYRLSCWLASYSELQRQASGLDIDEFMKCCERSATPESE